jgi:hypothetical protein
MSKSKDARKEERKNHQRASKRKDWPKQKKEIKELDFLEEKDRLHLFPRQAAVHGIKLLLETPLLVPPNRLVLKRQNHEIPYPL